MKINPERLRYKNDKLSASLLYWAVLANIIFFITVYSSTTVVPNELMGFDIIVNIIFLLTTFYASEMVKNYNKKWTYGLIIIAIVQIARAFWIPNVYRNLEQLVGRSYNIAFYSLLISATFLIIAACRSYTLSNALEKYLKNLPPESKIGGH